MDNPSVLYAKSHKTEFLTKLIEGKEPVGVEDKTAIFMAGSPGAGKTEVATSLAEMLDNLCIIDADIFRS